MSFRRPTAAGIASNQGLLDVLTGLYERIDKPGGGNLTQFITTVVTAPGGPLPSLTINTTAPLTGGGPLSSSLTLALNIDGTLNVSGGALGIADHGVSYVKIQQESATTLLGNPTGSLANVQEVSLGPGLGFVNFGGGPVLTNTSPLAAGLTADAPLTMVTSSQIAINGSIVSGSASITAQNLGALTSGVLEQAVSGAVATLSAFSVGANRLPFGSGTNGQLTDSANLTFPAGVLTLASAGTAIELNAGSPQAIDKTNADLVIGTSDAHNVVLYQNNTNALAIRSGQAIATATGQLYFGASNPATQTFGNAAIEINITPPSASTTGTVQDLIVVDAVTQTLTGTGTVTTWGALHLKTITLTDASAGVVTNAATLLIDGSPFAGGSLTCTNPRAIWVKANATQLDGVVAINGVTPPTNVNLIVGHTTESDRDRAQFFLGGGTLGPTGTGDSTLFDLVPSNTSIIGKLPRTPAIYSTARIRSLTYTGGLLGDAAKVVASLYIDDAPAVTTLIAPAWGIYVANSSGNGGNIFAAGNIQSGAALSGVQVAAAGGAGQAFFAGSSGSLTVGFFGAGAGAGVGQQTGGAATAGATYTATEQGMINRMYSALRTYGLLT